VFSSGSAETNVVWGGKLNGRLMAGCVRNIRTKNYQNLLIGYHVTVENVVDVFLRHSVEYTEKIRQVNIVSFYLIFRGVIWWRRHLLCFHKKETRYLSLSVFVCSFIFSTVSAAEKLQISNNIHCIWIILFILKQAAKQSKMQANFCFQSPSSRHPPRFHFLLVLHPCWFL